MKNKHVLFRGLMALMMAVSGHISSYAEKVPMMLWYDKPARNWMTSALPVGNGELGAMFFGGISQERIQFNEKSLWTGSRTSRGAYQNFGDIYLNFNQHKDVSGYRRELSLDQALGKVSYEIGGINYEREYFASNPDSVVVVRLTTSGVKNGLTFDVEEIPFCLDVPRGMGFYSAHHKIDAYRYLATLDDTYSFLLDNDVVCLGKMPDYVPELIARDAAIYYSYPICRVENHDVKVMQHIAGEGKIVTGLWVGGEFLAGSASFFADLWATVMSFADRYFEMRDSVFHQGDEMLASIAIEELMLGGRHLLVDGGPIGIVYRYLSVYEHKPIDYYSSWFAHLICDKAFLADIDVKSINSNDDFLKVYKKYCKREVALRKMYKKTKALLRR